MHGLLQTQRETEEVKTDEGVQGLLILFTPTQRNLGVVRGGGIREGCVTLGLVSRNENADLRKHTLGIFKLYQFPRKIKLPAAFVFYL